MGSVKVYGPVMSTAVSRVLACLLEKEVPFHLVPVSLAKAHHKSPDFLNLQPFGQVPAFQDGDVTLFESRAICRYICDKFVGQGNQSLMGPEGGGAAGRAAVDQWVEAEAQSFNPPSTALVFQLVFAPKMRLKQDPNATRDAEGRLRKVLDVYERHLGGSRFLAGEEFSLADLCHLPNAHYLLAETDRGQQLLWSRRNVARWWEEISGRPSWAKVVEMRRNAAA
ncbi:glutathione S-transferase F11-like isoform X1 [Ananas comosus]|uniref:glutathione transferase n=1 Tax=Ananas comosus TaxID=4615 RepID=A0A6P5FA89_ANACO|nr:glutathione S-transferase F11-like isoform X1 [Ananas comosus]